MVVLDLKTNDKQRNDRARTKTVKCHSKSHEPLKKIAGKM